MNPGHLIYTTCQAVIAGSKRHPSESKESNWDEEAVCLPLAPARLPVRGGLLETEPAESPRLGLHVSLPPHPVTAVHFFLSLGIVWDRGQELTLKCIELHIVPR